MQSFDLTATFDLRAVVPQCFLQKMRNEARDSEASTAFLQAMDTQYPDDDDAFMLALLRHAVRRIVAGAVYDEFRAVGLGGTFSPATVRDRTPPEGEAVNLVDLRHAIPA